MIAVLVLILASGVLKGFDPLLNLVLDGTTEHLRGTVSLLCLLNFAGFELVIMVAIYLEIVDSQEIKSGHLFIRSWKAGHGIHQSHQRLWRE